MRIISGKAKGIKLDGPPVASRCIRPTSDRCKEALFSIIADRVEGSTVLDLYAGAGSLGLEALSRGARSAVFIDNSTTSLSLIKRNAEKTLNSFDAVDTHPQLSIIKGALPKALGYVLRNIDDQQLPFNIIFLDPPYDKGLIQQTLMKLNATPYLADDGIIIAESRSTENMPRLQGHIELFDRRKYGDTSFWFYTKQ